MRLTASDDEAVTEEDIDDWFCDDSSNNIENPAASDSSPVLEEPVAAQEPDVELPVEPPAEEPEDSEWAMPTKKKDKKSKKQSSWFEPPEAN